MQLILSESITTSKDKTKWTTLPTLLHHLTPKRRRGYTLFANDTTTSPKIAVGLERMHQSAIVVEKLDMKQMSIGRTLQTKVKHILIRNKMKGKKNPVSSSSKGKGKGNACTNVAE